MSRARTVPCCLTIAGSDSGGGAGIQADLNTFAALGVHGTTAITCLTAQNPEGVLGIQAARPNLVRLQLEAIAAAFPLRACKTGMLFDRPIIREVARFLGRHSPAVPLVVDPVMVATSGALLLQPSAVRALEEDLIPKAALVTPNVMEAERLTGLKIQGPEDLRLAARRLVKRFGCAALVKGGHLGGGRSEEAADLFFDGRTELLLTSRRVRRVHTHGTGCTFSAAIAAYLARGYALAKAVIQAKTFIGQAIAHHRAVGRHSVLGWRQAR